MKPILKLLSSDSADVVWLEWGRKKLAQLSAILTGPFSRQFMMEEGLRVELTRGPASSSVVVHRTSADEGVTFYQVGGGESELDGSQYPHTYGNSMMALDVRVSDGAFSVRKGKLPPKCYTRPLYVYRRAGDFSAHLWAFSMRPFITSAPGGAEEYVVSCSASGASTKVISVNPSGEYSSAFSTYQSQYTTDNIGVNVASVNFDTREAVISIENYAVGREWRTEQFSVTLSESWTCWLTNTTVAFDSPPSKDHSEIQLDGSTQIEITFHPGGGRAARFLPVGISYSSGPRPTTKILVHTYFVPRDAVASTLTASADSIDANGGTAYIRFKYGWESESVELSPYAGTVTRHSDGTIASAQYYLDNTEAYVPAFDTYLRFEEGRVTVRRTTDGELSTQFSPYDNFYGITLGGTPLLRLDLAPYHSGVQEIKRSKSVTDPYDTAGHESGTEGAIPTDGCGSYTSWHTYSAGMRTTSFEYAGYEGILHTETVHDTYSSSSSTTAGSGCRTNGYDRYMDYDTSETSEAHDTTVQKIAMYINGELVERTFPAVDSATITVTDTSYNTTDWTGWRDFGTFDGVQWQYDAVGSYGSSSETSIEPAAHPTHTYHDVFGNEYTVAERTIDVYSEASSSVDGTVYALSASSYTSPSGPPATTTTSFMIRTTPTMGELRTPYQLPEIGIYFDEKRVYQSDAGVLIGRAEDPELFGEHTSLWGTTTALGGMLTQSGNVRNITTNAARFYPSGGGAGTDNTSSSTTTHNGGRDVSGMKSITNGINAAVRAALFIYPASNTTYAAVFYVGIMLPWLRQLKQAVSYSAARTVAINAREYLLGEAVSTVDTEDARALGTDPATYTAAAAQFGSLANLLTAEEWSAQRDQFFDFHIGSQLILRWSNADASALFDFVNAPGTYIAGPFRVST